MFTTAEYIWLDGTTPTAQLRSKTRVLPVGDTGVQLSSFPMWSFDGSSTMQAEGHNSDLVLLPVNFCKNPLLPEGNFLVMCEVLDSDGAAHKSNTRAKLRDIFKTQQDQDPWIGFEQEYTFFAGNKALGWPSSGYPAPQGPYYCGVGSNNVCGREIMQKHQMACIDAGLMIFGTNAEVMLGQWEFQMGYRSVNGESADPLHVSDHLWMARWLLYRIAEDYNVVVSLDPKPVKGDWNGAGAHTNFSTKDMRDQTTGWETINHFINALSCTHNEHVKHYGHALNERLTGLHETCNINNFSFGAKNRGASIRIPDLVNKNKCGYIEDRRPGANCDPYLVSYMLLDTYSKRDTLVKKNEEFLESTQPAAVA